MSRSIDAPLDPRINPGAGKPAPATSLVNVPRLLAAYAERPDPSVQVQRVAFGTSSRGKEHLCEILREAQGIVDAALAEQ